MAVNLRWEDTFTICGLNFPTSYEIPVIALNNFGTKSDIKSYHAYMNSWKKIIGEKWKTRAKPENIMNKYVVAVLKDKQVEHLTKVKSESWAKTIFYFLRANQSSSAVFTVKRKRSNYENGLGLQISCTIKLKGEAKCIKILHKQQTLYS